VTTRAKYRERLPQLDDGLFLTDGGLETTLVFHEGFDLPCFAAFVLLDSERGRKALREYFDRYVPMAIRQAPASSPTQIGGQRSDTAGKRSLATTARRSTFYLSFATDMKRRPHP